MQKNRSGGLFTELRNWQFDTFKSKTTPPIVTILNSLSWGSNVLIDPRV